MTYILNSTRNTTWIATKALTRLGAVTAANPPSAEDLNTALDQLDVTAQDLIGRGIIYVADLDSTPTAIAHWLAEKTAIDLKADFGYSAPDGQSSLRPAAQVELFLRRLSAVEPSYGPELVTFF